MGLIDIDSDTLLSGLLSAGAASGAKGNYLARVAAGLAQGERFRQGRATEARQRSQDEMQAEYKQLMMAKMRMDSEREQRADTQGQANADAVRSGLGGDFDPASFLKNNPTANVSALEQVLKTRQMMQPKASKFSTTPQYDQQGNAFILAEDGTMKPLDGVKARDPLKEVRLGNKVGFRTDFSPEITGEISLGQSPDSAASVAATLRGQNLTDSRARERLNFDQAGGADAGKPQFVDGQFVYKPTAENPQGRTVPAAGFQKSMGEGQKKQLSGIESLNGAVGEYVSQLDKWGKFSVLSPTARAEMGTKYNNLMLQAKEAYNLGVLNGPDLEILTAVVTDPRSYTGVITSKDALKNQATELSRIMSKVTAPAVRDGGASAEAGMPSSAKPALSPEDAQAREWATRNPMDPRAKQIMQRLGGG